MRLKTSFLALFLLAALLLSAGPVAAQTLKTAPQETAEDNPFDEIPDEYFDEADAFIKYCDGRVDLNQYHNCECLGYEYIEERIKNPKADRSAIILSISNKCIDATGAAGAAYQSCIGNAPMLPAHIKPEDYCQCFASTYAKLFERYQTSFDSKVMVRLQTEAHVTCTNPTLAKRLYPYGPQQ